MQDDKDKRIAELESQVHNLERDLIHDPLTGLKTRAFFEEEVGVYLASIVTNGEGKRKEWFGFRNITLIFFDIDHFKKVNDTFGHDVGDQVLKSVANALQTSLRTGDTLARWGGEEMVASLLGAGTEDAVKKAEEIREKVASLSFEATELKVTISAGVASADKGIDLAALVKKADDALYNAKEGGRNKVVAHAG